MYRLERVGSLIKSVFDDDNFCVTREFNGLKIQKGKLRIGHCLEASATSSSSSFASNNLHGRRSSSTTEDVAAESSARAAGRRLSGDAGAVRGGVRNEG